MLYCMYDLDNRKMNYDSWIKNNFPKEVGIVEDREQLGREITELFKYETPYEEESKIMKFIFPLPTLVALIGYRFGTYSLTARPVYMRGVGIVCWFFFCYGMYYEQNEILEEIQENRGR